jgi:hypothetical protein
MCNPIPCLSGVHSLTVTAVNYVARLQANDTALKPGAATLTMKPATHHPEWAEGERYHLSKPGAKHKLCQHTDDVPHRCRRTIPSPSLVRSRMWTACWHS